MLFVVIGRTVGKIFVWNTLQENFPVALLERFPEIVHVSKFFRLSSSIDRNVLVTIGRTVQKLLLRVYFMEIPRLLLQNEIGNFRDF